LGLTAEEDLLAVLAELRSELQLRVAVRRRHVEVVDAVVEDVFDLGWFAPSCSSQLSAIAPNVMTVLSWPVSPSGRVSMRAQSLRRVITVVGHEPTCTRPEPGSRFGRFTAVAAPPFGHEP
jgi:hypothetical protein